MLCHLIALTPVQAFFFPMSRALVVMSYLMSGTAYPFLNFLRTLFLHDLLSDYVVVNISPNNSSSLAFLNVYASLIRPFSTNSTIYSFSSSIFPPLEIFSFWETSTGITPSGTQKVLLTPMGRKYLIGSSPLASFLSITSPSKFSSSLLP